MERYEEKLFYNKMYIKGYPGVIPTISINSPIAILPAWFKKIILFKIDSG